MAVLKYLDTDGTWKVLTAVESGAATDVEISNNNIHLIDENGNKIGTGASLDTSTFSTKKVDVLPTEGISTKTIYLVPSSNDDDSDDYDEFIYVDGRFERLGSITAAEEKATEISEETLINSDAEASDIENLFK